MTEETDNNNVPNADPKQWTDENGVDWVEYIDGKRFYFDKDKNDWTEWQNPETATFEEGVPVTKNADSALEQPAQEAQAVVPLKPKIKIDVGKIKANIKYIIATAVVVVAGIAGIIAYNVVQSTGENASPENVLKAYIEALDANDYEKALGFAYDQESVTVANTLKDDGEKFPELTILDTSETESSNNTATLNFKLGDNTLSAPFIKTDKIGWMLEKPEFIVSFKLPEIDKAYELDAFAVTTKSGETLDASKTYYYNIYSLHSLKDFIKVKFAGTKAFKAFDESTSISDLWLKSYTYAFSDDFKKRLTAIANKFAYDTFTCSGDSKIAMYSCDKDDGYTKTAHKLKKGFSVDKDCKIDSTATELVESNFDSFTIKCDFGAKTHSSYYEDTDLITTVTYKDNKLSYTIDGYEIDTSYDSDYYVYFESKTITITE
jgi:hypothetical protein